jgi:hypothetical protein
MFALRPQRALFPNSGLGRPLSEKVCFVVKTVGRGTLRKDRFENKASATALVSNNRLSEILHTFLIKTDLFTSTNFGQLSLESGPFCRSEMS